MGFFSQIRHNLLIMQILEGSLNFLQRPTDITHITSSNPHPKTWRKLGVTNPLLGDKEMEAPN